MLLPYHSQSTHFHLRWGAGATCCFCCCLGWPARVVLPWRTESPGLHRWDGSLGNASGVTPTAKTIRTTASGKEWLCIKAVMYRATHLCNAFFYKRGSVAFFSPSLFSLIANICWLFLSRMICFDDLFAVGSSSVRVTA